MKFDPDVPNNLLEPEVPDPESPLDPENPLELDPELLDEENWLELDDLIT